MGDVNPIDSGDGVFTRREPYSQNYIMSTTSGTTVLPSLAAILSQTVGSAANWATFFPSYETASIAFEKLPIDLQNYISQRALNYDIDAVDLFRKIPEKLWDHPEVMEDWLRMMDVSHIKPQETYPELANDPKNVIWEPLGDNRGRGMSEMTGEEFKKALDNGNETGRELLGEVSSSSEIWIDLRELFHGFVQCAETLGYAITWVPREMWGTFMSNIVGMLKRLRAAVGWTAKLRVAKEWVQKDVKHWIKVHKHPMAACFMLAVLTLEMPALAFLVTTWACTGLLGLAVHVLKYIVQYADSKAYYRGRKLEWLSTMLNHFKMGLNKLEIWIGRIHNILNSIKNGIFGAAKVAADLLFAAGEYAWKQLIAPAGRKVIEAAQNAFAGFLGWIDGQLTNLTGHAFA